MAEQHVTSGQPRWDPDHYLAFSDERGRPYVDLVARVGAAKPRRVVDLGCGPGNLTRLLSQRWPDAEVVGIDSSPEMIERAKAAQQHSPGPRYELGDLRDWTPSEPVDVLVSNATLQWVPDHIHLLPQLVAAIAPQGWLALQVPGNFEEPSHLLLDEIGRNDRFAAYLSDIARPAASDAATYLSLLQELDCTVDAWETTYLHVLQGADAVFTWISGTGARPTLQALPEPLRSDFVKDYTAALRDAYPPGPHGTLMPFRRVFVVAQVKS